MLRADNLFFIIHGTRWPRRRHSPCCDATTLVLLYRRLCAALYAGEPTTLALLTERVSSADGRTLVAVIIGLAHALKLKVVAEGVETEAQLRASAFTLRRHEGLPV